MLSVLFFPFITQKFGQNEKNIYLKENRKEKKRKGDNNSVWQGLAVKGFGGKLSDASCKS